MYEGRNPLVTSGKSTHFQITLGTGKYLHLNWNKQVCKLNERLDPNRSKQLHCSDFEYPCARLSCVIDNWSLHHSICPTTHSLKPYFRQFHCILHFHPTQCFCHCAFAGLMNIYIVRAFMRRLSTKRIYIEI